MTPRPSSRSRRVWSRSASCPSATKPPSRASRGGSATSASSSRSTSVSWPSRSPAASRSTGGASPGSRAAMAAPCVSPARIAARSRGPPRSSASRDSARSMSGTRASAPRRSESNRASAASAATASWRAAIRPKSRDGALIRRSSRRAPGAVTVRSMAASSDPSRPPDRAWVSSRLRRVAASICIAPPARSRTGGRSSGRRPFCVMSR